MSTQGNIRPCLLCGRKFDTRHAFDCRARKVDGEYVGAARRPTVIATDPAMVREICLRPYTGSREDAIASILRQNSILTQPEPE